jgi:hypothetical protein
MMLWLRLREGAVLDFPAPVVRRDAFRWIATVWPDASAPAGWARAVWRPSPFGGWLPIALNPASIVEFGADLPVRRFRVRWLPVRWYCIAAERRDDYLGLFGPFETPAQAHDLATKLRSGEAV